MMMYNKNVLMILFVLVQIFVMGKGKQMDTIAQLQRNAYVQMQLAIQVVIVMTPVKPIP